MSEDSNSNPTNNSTRIYILTVTHGWLSSRAMYICAFLNNIYIRWASEQQPDHYNVGLSHDIRCVNTQWGEEFGGDKC